MVKNRSSIQGHSPIPISNNVVISLDDLACSLDMEEWNLVAMEAVGTEDGTKTGINLTLQLLKKSLEPINIFKISERNK